MIWEVCWDGLWTLSFGPSQFHGHGPWLVCEVALRMYGFQTLLLFHIDFEIGIKDMFSKHTKMEQTGTY